MRATMIQAKQDAILRHQKPAAAKILIIRSGRKLAQNASI